MNLVKAAKERRKWARLPLAIPVFIRSYDHKGNEMLEFATALNVSAGGMLIAVRKAIPSAGQIRLQIPVAALGLRPRPSRDLRARAVRRMPADGYYLLGLKFSRPLLHSRAANGSRKRKSNSVS